MDSCKFNISLIIEIIFNTIFANYFKILFIKNINLIIFLPQKIITMAKQNQSIAELRAMTIIQIERELDYCNANDTPIVCQMVSTPQGRQKIVDLILEYEDHKLLFVLVSIFFFVHLQRMKKRYFTLSCQKEGRFWWQWCLNDESGCEGPLDLETNKTKNVEDILNNRSSLTSFLKVEN